MKKTLSVILLTSLLFSGCATLDTLLYTYITPEDNTSLQQEFAKYDKNDLGKWYIGNVVNDFNEPTGKHFAGSKQDGLFSNNLVNNQYSAIYFYIFDKNHIKLELKEYKTEFAILSANRILDIKIKLDSGEIKKIKAHFSGSTIWIDNPRVLHQLMVDNNQLKINICSKNTNTYDRIYYQYIVDTSHYQNAFAALIQ